MVQASHAKTGCQLRPVRLKSICVPRVSSFDCFDISRLHYALALVDAGRLSDGILATATITAIKSSLSAGAYIQNYICVTNPNLPWSEVERAAEP